MKYNKTIDSIIENSARILGEGHAIYDNEEQQDELVQYLLEQFKEYFEKLKEESKSNEEQVAKDIYSFFLKTEGKLISEVDTSKDPVYQENGEIYISLNSMMKDLYDYCSNTILND